MEQRTEHDLLGDYRVPASAYWGVHTGRAKENFPITGQKIGDYRTLIESLALVKMSAAQANHELGLLDDQRTAAIVQACQEVEAGKFDQEFIVDPIQGGAGTSTNMNANEVIANRALEILGHHKGEYQFLHPNDHVNLSQSTNDFYPTALRVAVIKQSAFLDQALSHIEEVFLSKAKEFAQIIKMGRTQLQDAVPMTVGQEFKAFAVMIGEDRLRLGEATELLKEINLGATAIGTSLNAPQQYVEKSCEYLVAASGIDLRTADNLVEATSDTGAFVTFSAVLKRIAIKLSKISNDLRLLSSGPRAGFGDLQLPAVQAGSSIMPGKVNPVIPEVVSQVSFEIVGNDVTITMASEAGQLQLNAFEPVIAYKLMSGMEHLGAATAVLADRCVSGITVNEEKLSETVENSIGLATALNPSVGYAIASSIAKEALRDNRTVAEVVLERGILTPEELDEALKIEKLVGTQHD